jgi:hypothetical protein
MQFNNPASTKKRKQKCDNVTLKKINRRVAFAARFPSHPTSVGLLRAFADSAGGT